MTYVSLKVGADSEAGVGDRSRAGLGSFRLLSSVWTSYRLWKARVSARQNLSELDEHLLADIGLTRRQVSREVAKPFWKPVDPS